MKHQPQVYIAGVAMPCEFGPNGNAVVLDDLRIPWGRDSLYSPTNPSECHLTLLDPVGDWASDPALFGAELRIDTDLGVLFRGRIDGISMEPVTIGGDPNPDPPYTETWRETRRNIVRSPLPASLANLGASAGTLALVPGDGVKWTRTATGGARALEVRIGSDLGPAGSVCTFRAEVMTSRTLVLSIRANATSSTTMAEIATINPAPGVWQTIEVQVTIPNWTLNATMAGFTFAQTSGGVVGDVIYWRHLQAEHAPKPLGPSFDGDTPSSGQYRYSWLGAANASASIQETATIEGGGWAPPPQNRDVWQVDITATDVIAQLASTVAPGYETTTTVPEQLEVLRSDWGPGFWDRADTQSRLQAIENRIKSLGINVDVEAIDFATIAPPGVPYWAYFREPYRRAQDDLYTLVQSVQMRSNEPIHTNYIPGTRVLAEGGFPDAAALLLTYVNSVLDVGRDPAYGLAYMVDCNAVAMDGSAAVTSTVEFSIGNIRVTQSDYSVQSYVQNNKTFQVVKFGQGQVSRAIAGGVAAYEPTAMDISNESILYAAPTGQVQSQTADAFAASIAPSILAVNGKLIPPPLTFRIEENTFGADVEAAIMATYTPDNGAFAFPGAVYESLIGWGPFFQMIGGELRFQQGWEITIQFAPSPAAAVGGLNIDQIVTNSVPTFDQYASRVSLTTLGMITKGVA